MSNEKKKINILTSSESSTTPTLYTPNFTPFFDTYRIFYPEKPLPTSTFLEWFIGFAEGDGSFSIAKRGDLQLVVTQSTQDVQILNYIKDNLGLGTVTLQSRSQHTHRWVIQDTKNLYLMCKLFNGNIVFPMRNFKFLEFLSCLNTKLVKYFAYKPMEPILATLTPSLNDAWLSGFTDAEGCFSISILSNSKAVRIRYILSQKWESNKPVLEHILFLFNKEANCPKSIGAVVPHFHIDNFELRVNGIKNCEYLFRYFDTHCLKSKKQLSYFKWKTLHKALSEWAHLDPILRIKLVEQSKTINSA